MVAKAYALSREQLVNTLIAYEGYASANGAALGTSVIDANLIGSNDKITEKAVLILEGPAAGEDQPATGFNTVTGEITTGAFSAQITEGTHFRVLNISSVELDMLNVLARIGTNADAAGTTTLFAWMAKLWGGVAGSVVASGTFTTSSATVPADTARAEADNFWNGCWLMPLTGAQAFQQKKIVDFANAGGVFTLDPEHPLDAVPGLVTYVILRATDDLVPSAGYIGNYTPAHVIGNKADAAVTAVGAVASVIAYIKGLLNQVATVITQVATTVAGRLQMVADTIDLNQAAATYDLLTGTTQVVILESLVIQMPVGAAGGALTSISIQTDDATPAVIIDAVNGAVANLTSENQIAWTGAIRIMVGTKIQLTIAGGATGAGYVCNINAGYRAVVSGGTLA